MLRAARRKYRTQKVGKKSPSGHHPTTLSGYIFARHVSTIGKKLVKQPYLPQMSPQYGELRPTSGWDRFGSLGHRCKFQRVSRLGSVTARHSSSGRQPNFAALNRRRHLYSVGRPSRWALAHISSCCDNCRVYIDLLSCPSYSWYDFLFFLVRDVHYSKVTSILLAALLSPLYRLLVLLVLSLSSSSLSSLSCYLSSLSSCPL